MKQILKKLDGLNSADLDFENFGKSLHKIDFSKVKYKEFIPKTTDPSNYSRNVLRNDSLECVIIHWPYCVDSAIHRHTGFWCYFAVLEGTCENTWYSFKDAILKENETMRGTAGQIMSVEEGHIHKMFNPDKNNPLITAHFYYPMRQTMEDVIIYDTENGKLGVLNGRAVTASWNEPREHFKSITENAFKYVPRF